MIEVKVGWMHIQAKGHAMYADSGKDIVCAGASTLLQAAAAALEEMEMENKCIHPEIRMQPGDVDIKADPVGAVPIVQTLSVFQTLECGMRMMAQEYPENVVIADAGAFE